MIQVFGYGEDTTEQVEDADVNNSNKVTNNEELEVSLSAPVSGKLVKLEDVPDPVFSGGMMGYGVAIEPSHSTINSPVEGKVTMIAPTKHAIGIDTLDGAEILIHIGLETVELKGEGFEVQVSEGDSIKIGTPLVKFDKEAIVEKGYNTITPVIVTNSAEFSEIMPADATDVEEGQTILNIIKK